MANEQLYSSSAHQTDVISAAISGALVKKLVCVPLIYAEDLPQGTAVKLFRKDGSYTASSISEAATYSFSSSSVNAQSTVSATAAKTGLATKLTVEAEQFGNINMAKVIQGHANAIARSLDSDVLALFSSFSTSSQTATTIMTVNDLMDAVYKVVAQNAAPVGGALNAIVHHKQLNEVKKEVLQNGAAAFANESMISLLKNSPQASNGFAGTLPGLNLYQTSGLPTSASDTIACVFNSDMAFAGMYSPSVGVRQVWVGSGGFYNELASWVFSKVVIWNDAAACKVLSDT